MKYILAPSILSADFTKLGEEMRITEENGAEYLHFDVMDGMFVPNISFGVPVLKSIHGATGQVMDAHLMVQEPVRYVEAFAKAGADIITVHLEACKDIRATISEIRRCGVKAGLSICPGTDVADLRPLLPMVDMVLIMSVHPGFGGQTFIPESLGRIQKTRAMLKEEGLSADIQVDGGLSAANVKDILDAGANIAVLGSGIFNGDVAQNTKEVMRILRSYG